MAQSLNLSVSGLYTSISDFNGLPPGALNQALNVESRYKNVLGPRRGFEHLTNSVMTGVNLIRLINFLIGGTDRTVAVTDGGTLVYYDGTNPWPAVPGNFSTGITAPDSMLAKSRFVKAGQNLYVTSQDGIRSLSSGVSAGTLRAGVPKGLNLEADTNGDTSGFFDPNEVLSTTGNITSGGANVVSLADTTGIVIGQYVAGTGIPDGTKVLSITEPATVLIQTGNTTAGSTSVTNLASNAGLVAGLTVSGTGIPEGAKINSISGAGPYTVVLSIAAFQTATASTITFTSALVVTLDQNATATASSTPLSFYSGSQVGYRIVFGRIETDKDGNTITRLGAPSAVAIATNTTGVPTNVTVTATLPKNSNGMISFYQLYRSEQTDSIDITPLDQYNLVVEANLTSSDFTARVITITDKTPDSLKGIPLYAGSDREGILQANDPPPMAWDICPFRDFMIYGNITQPSSLQFTVLSVGSPSGLQSGDVITVSGTFNGSLVSRTYTGGASENTATRTFKVFTTGTPSQNITDTVNSLIRVMNFDNVLPIHATLLSTSTDLPGQILLEADYPSLDTFTVTASAHTAAYDPVLSTVTSETNTIKNGLIVSKSGELEATPATNLLRAGDSSAGILRVIPLRDYVVILKSDGIYKLQGTQPGNLVINPFDLTTKIVGPDTAVSLNSGVWMLSNQGVVSISDSGVGAKSIPIDDQLNRLMGGYLDAVIGNAFAIGYESDRKYILAIPTASDDTVPNLEYVYNYVTTSWWNWNRRMRAAYVNSSDGKLYISRADGAQTGVSKERKTGTYQDYVDEGTTLSITSLISGTVLELSSTDGVNVGDILYQSSNVFSAIVSVAYELSQVTVEASLGWTVASVEVRSAYECTMEWKQVFGDNPAFLRQFSEGLALFKNTRFTTASLNFVTDFSGSSDPVTVYGTGNGLWGLFPWGTIPWGGAILPDNIRFIIPQNKQMGSYLIPTMTIRQGFSDFQFQGLSISYSNQSGEVGL